MKFFTADSERNGTCYHEFYKGKWDGKTFWKQDSLSLHDDILLECKGFEAAIKEVIPEYDPLGETEVSFEAWKKIGQSIDKKDVASIELYQEADEWLEDVFKSYGCFTIIGI